MISERESQVVDVEAVISGLAGDAATIESEIQVIKSRGLAEKTIRALKLDQDPEFNSALRPPSLMAKLLNPRSYLPASWRGGGGGGFALSEEEEIRKQTARMGPVVSRQARRRYGRSVAGHHHSLHLGESAHGRAGG